MVRSQYTYRAPLSLLLILVFLGSFGMQDNVAYAAQKAPSYERIFYYTDSQAGKKSFLEHPNQIDIFAPQAYELSSEGVLSGGVDSILLDFSRQHGIQVMPLITNSGFSSSSVAQFLDNPAVQKSAIDQMVTEAKLYNYQGWQIDFEQIEASYRPAFSTFIEQFGQRMKENGLISSVAVIAEIGEDPDLYRNNLWQRIIGVYDYAALGKSVDFLSIMSYDDPDSKGPIARYDWLKKVIDYTLSVVPAEKVSLGVGLYYWQWNMETGKRVAIGGNKGIQKALKNRTVSQVYSKEQQAPYLTYAQKGKSHIIWFENGQSMKEKISLIKQNGLRGFSVWALGLEVPSVWKSIRRGG